MDKLFLIVCIATAFYIQYATAIRCYECNSHISPQCFNAPAQNESFQVTCGPMDNICRKSHAWIEANEGGLGPDERVVRSCGRNETGDRFDRPCFRVVGLSVEEDMCFCTKSLCNMAPNLNGLRLQTAIALLASAISHL